MYWERADADVRNPLTGQRCRLMSLNLLAAFWAVSFLFVISPGADWAYVISAGMRGRGVIPAVGGLLSGHLAATLVVAVGVGGLVAGTPMAMAVLTLAGAGYLLWLGINMLLTPSVPQAGDVQQKRTWSHWALKGACVSGLNPKVFLLFLALLPQFTDPQAIWPVPVQIISLGLAHILSCAVVYIAVGYSAKAVLRTRPSAARVVSQASGAAMVVIAIVLVVERFG